MADYTPVYTGGVIPWTATTSAAVVGGNVLIVSGNGTVSASTADSAVVVGVAAHDAASGARVSVWPLDGCIHELVASGAITAAGGVNADAAGQVKASGTGIPTQAAAGALIGTALTTAAGSPLKLRVQGRR
jgi:predicted transcriptional regulator